ncbi:UV-stimulated scaffold protein A isoform X2 [Betta splendens]|uniref:UV-stimulated scaffold protein A n=1 Tax=Betta splendens TaxID=158456 RepID=A0A9W2Y3L5_BETSP|nr:UV-stimulated scaffold protein A isoform X2 [Betta splendens]
MELSQRERLSELVEDLTTSGQQELNQDKIKELKKICKMSSDCIDHVYHTVMSQLNQEHSEIRLSAFQIASELFSRSHHFRTLLLDNFQDFLELTVETDSEQPLPPPKEIAKKLRSLALRTVQSWQTCYGTEYKKLALGYHFLKQVKKVDFQDAESRTIAQRRMEEERQRRMERILKGRMEAASKDMEEKYQEIKATLTEMESCMRLLLPDFGITNQIINSSPSTQTASNAYPSDDEQPRYSEDVKDDRKERRKQQKAETCQEDKKSCLKKNNSQDVSVKMKQELYEEEGVCEKRKDGNEKEEEGEGKLNNGQDPLNKNSEEDKEEDNVSLHGDLFIRNSGLISHSYSLDLNLSPGFHVKETEDNEAVISTVIDIHRLITYKHLPAVQGWVQIFIKAGAEQQLLRRALDLKKSLEAALQKHRELHIDYKTRVRKVMKASLQKREDYDDEDDDDDDEDDSDFDEVPEKEGYEPHVPEHLRAEYGLDPSPSTSAGSIPRKRSAAPPPQSSCSSFSSRQLKRLKEEEQDPTSAAATLHLLGVQTAQTSSSGPSSEQKPVDAPVVPFGLDLYYWGQEQPNAGKVIKAPLGEGKLCQRQDRRKCPFHGSIVPRDQDGRPCREEDRLREEEEKRRKAEEQLDWRDAELMRDIEAETGEDLGSGRVAKKGKGKKKKYPNLSDLKQSDNTSRSRLEKKVFNKSAMRRVAEVMSKADRRKHDKFSNQFNYALK